MNIKKFECRFFILALMAIVGFSSILNAQKTLVLNDSKQRYELGLFMEILKDPGGRLSFDDIQKPEYQSQFIPGSKKIPNLGYDKSAIWVRFGLRNEASTRSPWAILLESSTMDYAELYIPANDGKSFTVKKAGAMRPLRMRDYYDQHPVFLIPLLRSQTQLIYMRFQTEETMTIPLYVWSMTGFVGNVGWKHFINGILLGILLIMMAYNLFVFISLKDKNYLYFLLFIASLLFFTISYRGIGYRYFWPNLVALNKITLIFSSGLLVLSLLVFTDQFLLAKIQMPRLHRVLRAFIIATGILIICSFFLDYQLVIRPLTLVAFIGSFLILIAAIRSFQKGYAPARFLLLGFLIMSAGASSFLLVRMGFLPSTKLTEEGFTMGNILIMALMALALSDRIKILRVEKEKTDKSLKQSEEQVRILSRATEQSPVLVVITDRQGDIQYVNPRFTEVTGYSLDEVRGKNPRILKSGETAAAVYQDMWKTIASGGAWRGEIHNRKKNGEHYWESVFICPIKDEAGNTTHYLGLMEDITEHKELQGQFMQIQKMESIGTLAGGIAHDFNNILTVIRGYSDIALTKMGQGHAAYKDVSIIQSAGERAENLTRQILAFSRKQLYQPQIIDLNQIISNLKSLLDHLIREDIKMELVLSPGVAFIKADPGQIEQILVNLLINARDAIEQNAEAVSEKRITIETSETFLDEDYVRVHLGCKKGLHVVLSISDTGIGMTEETKRRIFDPFFTTKKGGTGLGLATVYGIIKQNDANIFFYSEPGKGTTFKILWPASAEKISKPNREEHDGMNLQGNEKILLAEDNQDVASFAQTVLEKAGYQVYMAENGKKALNLVEKKNIIADLLLTDLIMPDMNGKELAEKIKEKLPDIHVLFSSGYTDNHLVHSGELDSKFNFLPKPYSMKDLLRKVREILDR